MKYLFLICTSVLLYIPMLVQAAFQPFQQLPGLENVGDMTTQQYIDALYVIAITAAAILAVFKLIWAGVQYMLSEVVTNKQKAKQDIQGALLGLLIILAAVTILNTINPNLTQINFLRNAAPVQSISGESRETPVDEPVREPITCPDGLPETLHTDQFGMQQGTCIR